MGQRIFVAGATGAIGSRLVPLLRGAGHHVVAATRAEIRAESLRALGVDAVVVDVFDELALTRAIVAVRPDTVIHQLTDLPKDLDPALMGDAIVRNARVRDEGTRNLVRAAVASGARRIVTQSIAWAYAPGPLPHAETDPLDAEAEGGRGITVRGVVALEGRTLNSPALEGIVLRYGQIFGPGTHTNKPSNFIPVHVDAAAYAALLAVDHGRPGPFNIAQPNRHVATEKAIAELKWNANFRLPA